MPAPAYIIKSTRQKFKNTTLIFLLSALTAPLCANSAQTVDNISIEYPSPFLLNMEKSEQILNNLPSEFRPSVKSFYIYDAPGREGVHEADIIKITYNDWVTANLDGAAQGIVSKINSMPGVKNLQHTIQKSLVSGRDARRISVKADRWDGVIGAEALVIESSSINELSQIQIVFSESNNISFFSSFPEKRKFAANVISSVSIIE